ncbi:acyltransferase [Laetiporus sulphureus 93-53]|uniref:Acyltransferase n=1 Tax=Laetiporus sulphureus 93-53 TaxID=1314785 RepID=A0A165CXV9_9APHY|nr:acyltransferase [Laetiporus sulphureus 93-53]KZT03700.1 acyltransferase [Laetiporus sulphureus 93-53]
MEIQLVYRVLRKLSHWALSFYSEIQVVGEENVPSDGPIIVVSCHHNEILDIATLASTIPRCRLLRFWAKASLFKNPIARAILVLSGNIPVHRNPNSTRSSDIGTEANSSASASDSKQALFRQTFLALDRGEAIGVFPEGTSYTEPHIAQVKDGAAWAALEYMRWRRSHDQSRRADDGYGRLMVIPVGIVHTDKSRYLSRMSVRWGTPIDVVSFAERYLPEAGPDSPSDADTREAVRKLTKEIARRMVALTINAPDWDTVHAARMARDILWKDERNIPMANFAQISQQLIKLFSVSDGPASLRRVKRTLLRYYSFLNFTSLSHSSLSAVLPDSLSPRAPSTGEALLTFSRELAGTFLRFRFLLFLPVFLVHIPAYLLAHLGMRVLSSPYEEETHAQFKAVFGMIGAGISYGVAGSLLVRVLQRLPMSVAFSNESNGIKDPVAQVLRRAAVWLLCPGGPLKSGIQSLVSICGVAWLLSKWHNRLVGTNYRQFKRLVASLKLLIGLLSPRTADLTPDELQQYAKPPLPPVNPFLKRRSPPTSTGQPNGNGHSIDNDFCNGSRPANQNEPRPPTPSFRRLMRPLLSARAEATDALAKYLVDVENTSDLHNGELVDILQQLKKHGAHF